jgi:hypothetical protein
MLKNLSSRVDMMCALVTDVCNYTERVTDFGSLGVRVGYSRNKNPRCRSYLLYKQTISLRYLSGINIQKNVELKLPSQKSVKSCGPTDKNIKGTENSCGIKGLHTIFKQSGTPAQKFLHNYKLLFLKNLPLCRPQN